MKKQLPTDAIANELSGASAFFKSPQAQQTHPKPVKPHTSPDSRQTVKIFELPKQAEPQPTVAQSHAENHGTDKEIMIPRHHDTVVSHHQASTSSRNPEGMAPSMVETMRKAVKQFGKEAATHRFTQAEKRLLADIVYTYERQGIRTSENEITRIAINWLVLDYQEQGANSVLARLLEVLHR